MGWPGGKINVAAVSVKIFIFRASIGFKPMASAFLLKLLRLKITTAMVTTSFHLYFRSSHNFHSVSFPLGDKMNLINWPAPSVWVFIAQLVEHCRDHG